MRALGIKVPYSAAAILAAFCPCLEYRCCWLSYCDSEYPMRHINDSTIN
jgi:hypothetical protein